MYRWAVLEEWAGKPRAAQSTFSLWWPVCSVGLGFIPRLIIGSPFRNTPRLLRAKVVALWLKVLGHDVGKRKRRVQCEVRCFVVYSRVGGGCRGLTLGTGSKFAPGACGVSRRADRRVACFRKRMPWCGEVRRVFHLLCGVGDTENSSMDKFLGRVLSLGAQA